MYNYMYFKRTLLKGGGCLVNPVLGNYQYYDLDALITCILCTTGQIHPYAPQMSPPQYFKTEKHYLLISMF